MARIDIDGEINACYDSHLRDAPNPGRDGEAVAGSSDDDKGEVSVEWLPNDVDPADVTDAQRKALRAWLSTPADGRSFTRAAERAGVSRPTAVTAIRQHLGTDEQYGDLTEKQQAVIDYFAVNPQATETEAARETDVSPGFAGQVRGGFGDIIEQRTQTQTTRDMDETDTPDSDDDADAPSSSGAETFEAARGQLRDQLDDVRDAAEQLEAFGFDVAVDVEISADAEGVLGE